MRVNVYQDDKTETFKVSFCLVLLVPFCAEQDTKIKRKHILASVFQHFCRRTITKFASLLNKLSSAAVSCREPQKCKYVNCFFLYRFTFQKICRLRVL